MGQRMRLRGQKTTFGRTHNWRSTSWVDEAFSPSRRVVLNSSMGSCSDPTALILRVLLTKEMIPSSPVWRGAKRRTARQLRVSSFSAPYLEPAHLLEISQDSIRALQSTEDKTRVSSKSTGTAADARLTPAPSFAKSRTMDLFSGRTRLAGRFWTLIVLGFGLRSR